MKKILAVLVTLAPAVAFAQESTIVDANSLRDKLIGIGNLITYLLIAVAVIFIIWNVVMYLIRGGEEDRKKAGSQILWGIVGLFIILSIWGLVNILVGTFRTTPANTQIPQVQNVNNGDIPRVP